MTASGTAHETPRDTRDGGRSLAGSPEALRAFARREVPDDPGLGELAAAYFAAVPAEELVDDPRDALAAVRAHRSLARLRVPGRPVTAVLDTPAAGGESPDRVSVLVVTEDMPYLIDSVLAELGRTGATVHRVVHPVLVVRRDLRGELLDILPEVDPHDAPPGALAESWMNLELGDLPGSDPARDLAADLHTRLSSVLTDVREVVEDTDRMASTARSIADELEIGALATPAADDEQIVDTVALLRWCAQGNLTFLGYRRQDVVDTPDGPGLRGVLATGLGVLRRDSLVARRMTESPDSVTPKGTRSSDDPRSLLVLTRASARSTVHQPVHPLYIGISIFDDGGRLVGEHRFLGVLTVAARHADVLGIPVVSRRAQHVIAQTGLSVDSWSGQRLLEVLQTYPRAELLCTDDASLEATATGVLALAERRRVRLFLRRDPYGRYFSCMIYLPRDRYTTTVRTRMQRILLERLHGVDIEHTVRVTEDQLALLHVTVHTGREEPVVPDTEALSRELAEAARTWSDRMREFADGRERAVLATSGEPFGESYKEDFGPERGLADLRVLDGLDGPGDVAVRLYRPAADDPDGGERRLKLYLAGERAMLSSVLPALHSLGVRVVDERPYEVWRSDGTRCWINDFGLRTGTEIAETPVDGTADLTERFADTFTALWRDRTSADAYNTLVLRAGMTWRQAAVLRAVSRYLRQIGSPYGQSYITDVVVAHHEVAAGLVRLFEHRFDPDVAPAERSSRAAQLDAEVERLVDAVTSLDADRILRSMLGAVRAIVRTNWFRRDENGAPREVVALKLDPARIPGVPEPRPAIETFVHSNRVEGVHLRFGPIARGGLRWSDRLQDYRTEILGLVKAQAVKNAVIVPVGAKGGFVVKQPPAATGDAAADREAQRAEGVACYRMFVSGLLDLVDNRAGHGADSMITVPERVVRYDTDDPYLVVAADKGTATFSDEANAVAAGYGFWLGDAFASGGSVGYDHKAMGITARGAWESVRRHFRELDRDVALDEITVVGIGDMSGDVFGNGMLLSEHLKIVAAFDHRHVFLDPDPDPAASFAERSRLFGLVRSSWADYDPAVISAGGGVFSRTAKSVPVSAQAAAVLALEEGEVDPTVLVRAILRARVDLLWNGGIGTYVKASTETDAEAGDKSNDAVRVDGVELRAAVVGEGGNLGLTQRGRIEYARNGGKVNTDAIDNSAGVDCSDHEVNIKILLDSLVERGELAEHDRDEQIAATTDDVAALVLADNVAQNEVLGVSRSHTANMAHVLEGVVADLADRGKLDRELEVLPDAEEFAARRAAGEGLSSPELSTLLAHVKLDLTDSLAASELPDVDVFARTLPTYFPPMLADRYPDAVAAHPLRRQIVTTMLSNTVVDGGGLTYVHRLVDEVSASPADAVRAYHVATGVFGLDALTTDLAAAALPSQVSDGLTLQARRTLDRVSRWFLLHRPQPLAVAAETSRFSPTVGGLFDVVPQLLRGAEAEGFAASTERWVERGASVELARRSIGGLYAFGLLDIVEITELAEHYRIDGEKRDEREVAELYFALSDHLGMHRLLTAVAGLERIDRWAALARLSLRDELYSSLRAITLDVLADTDADESADAKIEHWEQANASRLERARTSLADIKRSGRTDLATVSVAARQVRSMVRT